MTGAHGQSELRLMHLCVRKSSGTAWTKSFFASFYRERTCCGVGKPCSSLHTAALQLAYGQALPPPKRKVKY